MKKNPLKIVLLSDIHFSNEKNIICKNRKGEYGDILLLRAVHRINRFIKPDITLILGDLINDPESEDAHELLKELKIIIDKLECPSMIIPGNHDIDSESFYKIFEKPADSIDVKGVRFAFFLDKEEPDYNASRTDKDIEKYKIARDSFNGQIVSVQHVPVFPPGKHECPYNYLNAEKIIKAMRKNNVNLSLAGHYHKGFDSLKDGNISFITSPALCEGPFKFLEIDLEENGNVSVKTHRLKNPEKTELIDYHIHTSLAYCNENMDMRKTLELAEAFGLKKAGFGEHSGHLYFDKYIYWKGAFLEEGINHSPMIDRMEEYFRNFKELDPEMALMGLEIDVDFHGRPIIKPEHWRQTQIPIGAVHYLSELKKENPDIEKAKKEFLAISEKFLKCGIRILAHPFRVFRRGGIETPEELFEPLAKMLKENNVAAEINFHTNEPPVKFFTMCIERQIKISLGSDSHNLYEVGEFAPHLDLIKKCGYDGDLTDILVQKEDVINKDFKK
jgi:histidinol phosphatase-like PHP family hydrolase/calcineurin-like phosphoesterase family protein